jgi:hypothetical protein
MVISYDHENRNARLSLRQNEILEALAADEKRHLVQLNGSLSTKSAAVVPIAAPMIALVLYKMSLTKQDQGYKADFSSRVWEVHVGSNSRRSLWA